MHTRHINNINPYMVASVARILFRPYLFKSVFAYHYVKAASSNKRTACNHHFHQKCHPQCVWSRDVTNQSFQGAGPNNRTTCILPFNFYHVPSGRSEQPGQLASPFYHSIIPNGKTEQPNSLRLPFYFYHVSSRQS